MLKNTIALALAATAVAAPAFSAVSGYWSSSKVLHAILGESRVADALRQQPIEAISKTDSGYRVESRDCAREVTGERWALVYDWA